MSVLHDSHSANYRLLSRSYDTSHSIFKGPLKVSSFVSEEKENTLERQEGLTRDGSKGMIKLGAKIRNVKDDAKYQRVRLGNRVDQSMSQIFSDQMAHSASQTIPDRFEKEYTPNLKLTFRRMESADMASTNMDSPRGSGFLETQSKLACNRFLPGEGGSGVEHDARKIGLETGSHLQKQRLEKIVEQRSAEIRALNHQLSEQKRANQARTRQLEVDVEMLKYTQQQTISSLNSKLDAMKKETLIKDNLVGQASRELKELKQYKNSQVSEISKIKEEHRRTTHNMESKQAKTQQDLKESNLRYLTLLEQKNRQEKSRLIMISKPTDENTKPYCSVPKRSSVSLSQGKVYSQQTSRIIELSRRNTPVPRPQDRAREEEILNLKRALEAKDMVIYCLSEERMRMQHRIMTLSTLIEQSNEERIKERLQRLNQEMEQEAAE